MSQFVTATEAEAILAELCPSRQDRPSIDQFREQVDATLEAIFAIDRTTARRRAIDKEFRQIRQCVERVKAELRAMAEISAAPEMANFSDLLKLNDTRAGLVSIERDLFLIVFSGRGEAPKGRASRAWYSGFIRDLAEIANEFGTEVTTAGDRTGAHIDDPYATPFTRFVFAVEKLLPSPQPSASLPACAKRIDRAIAASPIEIGEVIRRKEEPVNKVAEVLWDPANFLVDIGFRDARAV